MTARSWLRTIRLALKDEHRDYTRGDVSTAVVLLAVPMILELGLESVFAVVDMFFVSKLGQNAIATVGLTESVVTLIYSVAIGLSTGATAIVARRVGEGRTNEAGRVAAQCLLLSTAISILISVSGIAFAHEILLLMGAAPEVAAEGASFAQIMLGGNLAIILLFLINGLFRGAGDAAIAMKSLWLASAANIVLCPVFIHFWGLQGAAIATVAGRTAGVLYQLKRLASDGGAVRIRAADFTPDFDVLRSVVRIAWPASFQFLIGSGSWIVLTRLVAETGGTAASAGCQIAFRNFVFFILPAWGLSNAAATLVGQNLGAGRLDRAEESTRVTARYSAILMAIVTVAFLALAHPIVSAFTDDPVVLKHGVDALRLIGAGYVFYGVGMTLTQALNGAGDTKTPTWINFFCFWVVQTPLAYWLSKGLGMNANGAVLSIPISHALLAFIAWRIFKLGRWKTAQV